MSPSLTTAHIICPNFKRVIKFLRKVMADEFDIVCFEAVQDLTLKNEEYRKAVAAIRQQWLAVDRRVESRAGPVLDKIWSTLAGGNDSSIKPVSDASALPPFFGRMDLAPDDQPSPGTDPKVSASIGGIEEQKAVTNALASHIASMIDVEGASELDEAVLQHLQRVSSTTLDAPRVGFEVQFTFSSAARAYLSHKDGADNDSDGPVVIRIKCECDPVDLHVRKILGTNICWKKGFDPTVMEVDPSNFGGDDTAAKGSSKRDRQQKKGDAKQQKKIVQTVPCPSFFNVFKAYDFDKPADAEHHAEKLALVRSLENFHSFSALLPTHSFWFPAPEAQDDGMECGFGDDMDFGDDEEGELEEGDEDDDDDEEDEEAVAQPPPTRKKARGDNSKGSSAAAPPEKKPECKQQ